VLARNARVEGVPIDLSHRWNHNTHYHRIVLDGLRSGATTALDVGTGDGLLAAELRERIPDVTGIDADAVVLDHARETGADVHWVLGDVMTHPLPEAHYDLVAAIATVHHLVDLSAGLARLADLTAPGGTVVVIGCARSASLTDYAVDVVGVAQHQVLSRTRRYWQHSAPLEMDFPHTYREARRIATTALPGMTWRRLPLFRYAVTWHKPI
jgi:ubiquinone/menaquinone biosynthesis C-methylase UbiE